MKEVLEKAKRLVKPSKSQILFKNEIANLAFGLVERHSSDYSEVTSVEFGGSFAKGTWLAEKADIDIFVKFKNNTSEKKFVDISKRIGFDALKKFKPYVRYSEHPYVEADIRGTKVNVVPCYDVSQGEWKSSADRSPFHTKFMKDNLYDDMKDEVRILKSFLKSQKIYGAEIAKQGFSGYVTEVLILNFGDFENTIRSISEIRENHLIGKTTKKFDTPIVIIDPIDSNRNLAAAISEDNLGKLILSCRTFIAKPSISFFKQKKKKISKKNWETVISIKFGFKKRSPDIIWGQIKKAAASVSTQLELGGFKVLRYRVFTDEENDAYLFFMLEAIEISEKYMKKGPDYFNMDDSKRFLEKNIKKSDLIWINEKRIVSLEKRKHNNAVKFLQDLLKNVSRSGIPAGLQSDIKRGFKIVVGGKSLSKSIKEEINELVSTNEAIFSSY